MRDMTKGNISKQMIVFAVPLMVGNMFQQLYGIINAVIVGRYLGKESLAAIGTAIPIMNIMLFLLFGMTMGASVLMAEFFGSGDEKLLKDEISTSALSGCIFTIILSTGGVLSIKPLLMLINTPHEIVAESELYLKIIFSGLIFAFIYDLMSSAMRAVGESFVPLLFLIASSILNIILAVVFVEYMDLGISGAAYATVASQLVSALLCLGYIKVKIPQIIPKSFFKLSPALLAKTVSYSSVSGVQQTVLYVGIFLLQGAVNKLGIDSIAAFNAACRIDSFILAPSNSLASSLMMFASQNKGAGEHFRVKCGLKYSMYINFACTSACSIMLFLIPEVLASMFLNPAENSAISIASDYLKIMSVIYLLSPLCNTMQGFFRGIGKMDVTLYATIIQIPIRVAFSYALVSFMDLNAVAAAIALGWIFMGLYLLLEYKKYLKTDNDHILRKV